MSSKGLGWVIIAIGFLAIMIFTIIAYFALLNMTDSAVGGGLTQTFVDGLLVLFGVIALVFVIMIIFLKLFNKYQGTLTNLGFLQQIL
jgi:hypothetical protein